MRASLPVSALALALVAGMAAACEDVSERPVGGTAVIAYAGAPRTANPLVASDAYSHDMNRFLLFLPLLRHDDDLELVPGLAREWAMEGDSAAVFRLHRDVRWSDGRLTTAEDVAFTFERALEPATGYPNRAQFAHVTAVEPVDSFTVRLRFEPVREPLASLPLLAIVPRHALDTVPAEGMPTASINQRPVTNGPFRVREARPGDRWVFEADTAHPASLGGRPYLDRLVWRAIPEAGAMAVELRSGDVDIAAAVRSELFDDLTEREGYHGIERQTLDYTTIAWNGRRTPLDDARVRMAIGLAIDRRQILNALRGGHGSLATGPVPNSHWAHSSSLAPLPHDTGGARRLLAEAGYRDRDGDRVVEDPAGRPLDLTLLLPAGSDFNRDLAQVLQSDLADVGVRLELTPLEFGTLVQIITGPERDFDGVLLGLTADPRLDLRSLFHSESMDGPFQLAGYSNPVVDSLLDAIEAADRGRAVQLWAEVQEVLAEDQPWTFLHGGTELVVARERVQGLTQRLLADAADWWVQP